VRSTSGFCARGWRGRNSAINRCSDRAIDDRPAPARHRPR
jgi:hypothetical protein